MRFLKYSLVLIFFYAVTAFAPANDEATEEVEWISFDEAIERNAKEPRMILVDMYTDWCGWCKRMDRDVYSKQEIASYINKKYYAVKFNTERYKEDIEFQGRVWKFVPPPTEVEEVFTTWHTR